MTDDDLGHRQAKILATLRQFPDGASQREVWDAMETPGRRQPRYTKSVVRAGLEQLVKDELASKGKDHVTNAVTYYPEHAAGGTSDLSATAEED